jgi:ATP-binding cassette subfamily B protein
MDIQTMPRNEYLQHIGVILQDFVQYNFSLRENIQLGRKDMPNTWRDTLADITGVNKIITKLPFGYDSLLGKMFQGGSEVSMGQWQSIALMRALWTNPPIWILDEPTGWMDADKENHFLRELPKLAHDKLVILSHHAPVELLTKLTEVHVISI